LKFRRHHTWIILLAGLVFGACDTATIPSDLSDVQGTWELEAFELNNDDTVSVPNPQNFKIVFDPDGSIGVTADCNLCGGIYEANGNSISIEVQVCTQAYCGDQSLDRDYLEALGITSRYSRRGQELLLDYDNGTMRFQLSQ
jgi:heat shock protein HslJ